MPEAAKISQAFPDGPRNQERSLEPSQNEKGTDDVETKSLSGSSSATTVVGDGDAAAPKTTDSKEENDPQAAPTETEKKSSKSTKTEEKTDQKATKGWINRGPFRIIKRKIEDKPKKYVNWYDLTLREKYEYRKQFLFQYLRETKACLPHVKRLFLAIYRISPWRAAVLLMLNVVNGLVPAMTLQTQGRFIILVLS
jgi:hypothetical protein